MKIFVCSLFFTMIMLLYPVESMDQIPHFPRMEIVKHGEKVYGFRFDETVYPYGTYRMKRESPSGPLIPQFIDDPVEPITTDKVCRDGKIVGRPYRGACYKARPNGQFVFKRVEKIPFVPSSGDILVREEKRLAVYEGGKFRLYDADHQTPYKYEEESSVYFLLRKAREVSTDSSKTPGISVTLKAAFDSLTRYPEAQKM